MTLATAIAKIYNQIKFTCTDDDEIQIDDLLNNNEYVQMAILSHARRGSTELALKKVITAEMDNDKCQGTRLLRQIMKKLTENNNKKSICDKYNFRTICQDGDTLWPMMANGDSLKHILSLFFKFYTFA